MVFHFSFQTVGQRDERQRGLRLGAHRKDVAQGVGRRDLAEDVRIVDECAKEIDGVNQDEPFRDADDRGVVRGMQADHDVRTVHGREPRQCTVE